MGRMLDPQVQLAAYKLEQGTKKEEERMYDLQPHMGVNAGQGGKHRTEYSDLALKASYARPQGGIMMARANTMYSLSGSTGDIGRG